MDDADRERQGEDDVEYLAADQRPYYEDSPKRGEGLREKVRGAVEGFIHGEQDGPVDRDTAGRRREEPGVASGETEAATTDYMTSNWAEDSGRAPTESDVEDVNKTYE